jgi:hypothetical protein
MSDNPSMQGAAGEHLNEGSAIEVVLTKGAIDNGYILLPSDQALVPAKFVADETGQSHDQFNLLLPNGEIRQTRILSKFNRIQLRLGALFKHHALRPGDNPSPFITPGIWANSTILLLAHLRIRADTFTCTRSQILSLHRAG